ncbi:23S rRNA (uracil(1939)-C(5))-methyltransferase RlmD [Desulfuribacillus alkaliarsenatis]|uniref:23S rRNA (Uracil-5-)-methyltransferase RumA n=1 Tax=Desulfuribacillus alkaliarsenatis TaxID=766136 RepID=A0A1E5G227_9FIRM|nr:23S rRNA (uracil(1939)-C(5))-methyltransferase RlmD [Desulfuribacillus alkaliarsenatis]OEF97040.1 23S rRNA (uracil-5-)-methyltransferase RumA [Desulfuribacillus alkaliarsenatis]
MNRQIPVQKNQTIELHIHTLGHDGQGIGRYEDFTVFVPEALPGEYIQAKIIKVQKNYAVGKLLEISDNKTASLRVDPLCGIAKRCGGCQLQHMDYQAQLLFKQQLVIDNLERIGKFKDIQVHPTIGMENPWSYRNKAQVPIGSTDSEAGLISGFYAAKSHEIIPFDSCAIQHSQNDELVLAVRKIAEKYGVSAYNEKLHKGLLRHIVVRTAFTTNEVMVVIVVNGKSMPHQDKIINEIATLSANIKSICLSINTKKTNVIFGEQTKVLYGSDKIFDYIGDIRFGISARSFYQVNPVQTEVLYTKALEYAALTGKETVIDAYCGIGTITLFLAQKAKKVYGVEIVPEAIEDAKYNAEINGITNVEFAVAKAEDWIPKLSIRPEVIVVDPPRKGCDQALLDTIIDMRPKRVVYVSCNPSTLARDLRILADGGYELKEVQPVDMFPHTTHVECVVLMSRVDK